MIGTVDHGTLRGRFVEVSGFTVGIETVTTNTAIFRFHVHARGGIFARADEIASLRSQRQQNGEAGVP
jgi:hypothetical protein